MQKNEKETLEYNRNEDAMKLLMSSLNRHLHKIYQGGGTKNIAKLHAQGKLTARERIDLLLDKDCQRFEIGEFAGYEMYQEYGGCPSGGVVVVVGYVAKRMCVVVANDATVKAGAWFPITAKKNLRAQDFAIENHLPIIYLVDSGGVFLPLQDEIFPDRDDFGRMFRNNSVMSAMGIPQIAAIMGSCVAGGAYLHFVRRGADCRKNRLGFFSRTRIGASCHWRTSRQRKPWRSYHALPTIGRYRLPNARRPNLHCYCTHFSIAIGA